MIGSLIAAAPALIRLFTDDDKSKAAIDLTKTVAKEASNALGIEAKDENDVMKHLESNPQDVLKLKELENRYKYDIKKLEFEKQKMYEQNTTQRWESDNKSGSNFARLLRPGLTVYLVVIATLLAFADGNAGDMKIKEHWATLFTTLCITAVGGYFTLRTYEKRTNSSKWK